MRINFMKDAKTYIVSKQQQKPIENGFEWEEETLQLSCSNQKPPFAYFALK